MDFFKIKKFRKVHKPVDPEKETEDKPQPLQEEMKMETNGNGGGGGGDDSNKSAKVEDSPANEIEEEDDDDFITNEVKRRLKELRRNSFMVLIPEETCLQDEEVEEEDEEEGETSSSDWKSLDVDNHHQPCYSFDELYDKYCERMLFFDRKSAQLLQEAGSQITLSPSPRSVSKKLVSTLRSLSFKKREESQDDDELLQQHQDDPYLDLETAYVAHICLTWEALHCQYMQLSHKMLSEPENTTCYSHLAQQFQQFQVLLQRFIENEPFEQGSRVENYARTRNSFPKLLQVPSVKDSEKKDNEVEELDSSILASDLIKILESSILTFRVFIKMDKKKPGSVLNLFGGHNQMASPLQQIQSALEKKEIKLKELVKKKKGWKKKSWPATLEEVELLFGLIDIKLISRALRMPRINKEQLLWCEEKLSKLEISESKFKRDGAPVLFPC
ncbi:Duf1666 family protein [Thalictrum thalictroides]|uniref:Duf1666 family protein n=1 Tax=Thalictrum thalictroides TaxID=46969 RepID=A0A7J6WIN7_THATH|nr:Duf1666 family protein [Thalictrum thalictroides]